MNTSPGTSGAKPAGTSVVIGLDIVAGMRIEVDGRWEEVTSATITAPDPVSRGRHVVIELADGRTLRRPSWSSHLVTAR